jgi:hypothetical protein
VPHSLSLALVSEGEVSSRAGHAVEVRVPSGGFASTLHVHEQVAQLLGGVCTTATAGAGDDSCRRLVVERLGPGITVASSSTTTMQRAGGSTASSQAEEAADVLHLVGPG